MAVGRGRWKERLLHPILVPLQTPTSRPGQSYPAPSCLCLKRPRWPQPHQHPSQTALFTPCHSLCKKLHPSQNTELSPEFGRQTLGVRVEGQSELKRGGKRRISLISPLGALSPTCCQRAKRQGFTLNDILLAMFGDPL